MAKVRVGDKLQGEAERAVRTMAVIISPVFAIIAVLAGMGIIYSDHYVNTAVALTVSALWVATSGYYYLVGSKSFTDKVFRLIAFHAYALIFLLFVVGFAQPFMSFFALLLLATYMYFGKKGLVLSTLSLFVATAYDTLVHFSTTPGILASNTIAVFSTTILGYAIISIISAQETRRKELVHSQERERLQYNRVLTIINNLTDAAFSTNDKGSIIMYNAASLDLLDTNAGIKGKKISDLFKLHDADGKKVDLLEILKSSNRATRRDDLVHVYTKDDSVRLEITYAPIRGTYSLSGRDGQGGYIIIARDVTKQKSLEEERDEFISVVSHELRTPITIVEGALSNLKLLTSRPGAVDKKVLDKSLTVGHGQVMYLAKIVNDLSTLSRAERGVSDEKEEIDVTELLQSMHHHYEGEAQSKGLVLNIDLGSRLGVVRASHLYLEELMQNLVTNAIKYTKEGTVTIIAKRSKDVITFSVKDTGIGIGRNDQAKIFGKFYRSEDYRTRETSGTGLGLYVSSKLARKLGTQIDIKSRLNHGSTFSFELPAE